MNIERGRSEVVRWKRKVFKKWNLCLFGSNISKILALKRQGFCKASWFRKGLIW
jgi:hypothetical protein